MGLLGWRGADLGLQPSCSVSFGEGEGEWGEERLPSEESDLLALRENHSSGA